MPGGEPTAAPEKAPAAAQEVGRPPAPADAAAVLALRSYMFMNNVGRDITNP